MNALFDSDSFLNKDRLLSQHQAVLFIIQGKADNPSLSHIKWIDLGCGKGQIIINLEQNLSLAARNKIEFFAYDISNDFLNVTLKQAQSLGFRNVNGKVGDITDFYKLYSADMCFDFITTINTIHEFPPLFIPELLFETVIRLNSNGSLLIYDMETLPSLELGAVTWLCEEMAEILDSFFLHLGIEQYNPKPVKFKHSSCFAWNIQIQRAYFGIDNKQLLNKREETIVATKATVSAILERKLNDCRRALDIITKNGTYNEDEYKMKDRLLYDFWALERLKGENND